jgi:hypothetical protein
MRSRGVLDRPVKPGDDSSNCGGRQSIIVIVSEAKQSTLPCGGMDCFASLAMTA